MGSYTTLYGVLYWLAQQRWYRALAWAARTGLIILVSIAAVGYAVVWWAAWLVRGMCK